MIMTELNLTRVTNRIGKRTDTYYFDDDIHYAEGTEIRKLGIRLRMKLFLFTLMATTIMPYSNG